IDDETRTLLHQLNAAIHRLGDAEATRVEAEKALWLQQNPKARLGALGRWAAGGGVAKKSPEEGGEDQRREGVKTVRENVVWFLRERLRRVGELQAGMVETRLEREVERSKSVLYKAKGGVQPQMGVGDGDMGGFAGANGGFHGANGWEMDEMAKERGEEGMQLDEEQLQLFAKENQDMLKHYENTLDQVRKAESSLLEISQLQSTLAENLAAQSTQIEFLVQDSFQTEENVGKGNKELKRASERKSTARMVFLSTCVL
ncbi:hypothetical protein LTS18_001406, partial [Coniosporium uncinatum]